MFIPDKENTLPNALRGGISLRFEKSQKSQGGACVELSPTPCIDLTSTPGEFEWLEGREWFIRYRRYQKGGAWTPVIQDVWVGGKTPEHLPFLVSVEYRIWERLKKAGFTFPNLLRALQPEGLSELFPGNEILEDELEVNRFGMLWLVHSGFERDALEKEVAFRARLPDLFFRKEGETDTAIRKRFGNRRDLEAQCREIAGTDVIHTGHRVSIPYRVGLTSVREINGTVEHSPHVRSIDLIDGSLFSPTFGIRNLIEPMFVVPWEGAVQVLPLGKVDLAV